ncbi:hypothetical protein D1B31_18055 [Neobacillus notoginsengisoli]|uniref:Uncharacterized protein n=1 Tax=Neobacillus notoginsengisoli TaxID=1578198 RepID=A0A417YQ78_9BACI|nr:hypothetical protein [Neobacillus notoginsengisoli]RHW35992.1 hypothetical protein D1B31_18055 [Neobacillus notoginsengisoli]
MNDKIVSVFEALIAKVLGWFIGPFKDLDTFVDLIYGNIKDAKYYGIFTEAQFGVIAQGMAVMQSLSVGIILISIVMAGMRIASSGINPSNRTYSLEYFKDFIIVALLFFNLSTIFELIFTVNSMFVSSFSSAKNIIDADIAKQAEAFSAQGVLGGLVIGLCLLGLWIWANFYYMMRTLTLMILTIMSPLAVALYLIPQTKGITAGLFKEYTGTVFVQSVHAALYWVISSLAGAENASIGSIIMYMIFIPVSESVRSLLGLGGQMNDRLSKTAAMFGGAALMGVYGSMKGALSGQSVAQSLRGAAGQATKGLKGGQGGEEGEAKGLLSAAGTDIGSTSRAERMLKAGEITSKMGKAVFGAAGAFVGSPMGPMGAIAGSTAGFATGGVVGGVAGRAGMAGAEAVGNRLKAAGLAGSKKAKGIWNAESQADDKLANTLADEETTKWASANKDEFMKDVKERFPDITEAAKNQMWDKEVASKHGEFLKKAKGTVGQIKSTSGQHARASELVDSTVNNLTNDWANKNKDSFMKEYDANNPLPANPSEGDILKHNQNKQAAWNQTVANKKDAISSIASGAASKLGLNTPSDLSFINKDDFAKEVGSQVGSVVGMGAREGQMAVKGATSGVKTASLYSGKSVNTDLLTHQLASAKTNSAKDGFIKDRTANHNLSEQQAEQEWKETKAPELFKKNYSELAASPSDGGIPKHIPLDHKIAGNSVVKGVRAAVGAGAHGLYAASGVGEVNKFVSDTKLGHGLKSFVVGRREAWNNRDMNQSIVTAGVESLGAGFSAGVEGFKGHVADNVIGKQAGFKNAVAYTAGIAGGVRGYQAGATYAAGNTQNTKAFGLKGLNPYNNAVNNQIAEISEIQQMVETVPGPDGKPMISSGAIRMVTSAQQTVLQVRDKSGQIQTVSRIGSGDSSLKKGETLFQDVSIQDGQFAPVSNVYSEDSGGGRIQSNRTINVNPNKIVANRNSTKNPRRVQEVQSYNQLVDSGQYYLNDAMNEMSDIQMVVDRNRSYLVGSKEGKQYRISPYGPGDARLPQGDEKVRVCEVRNRQLVVSPTDDYTSSLQPKDLVPMVQPNKRSIQRRQNEQARNNSLTESLR